jgi:hypothetical protein
VASTFAGGPYNATGYWFPCPIKTNPFSNGKNYAVKPFQVIIYYTENPGTKTLAVQRLARGLRYVLGVNMDDPDDCGVKNEISLANGGTGTGCTGTGPSSRYAYLTNGFSGWACQDTVSNPSSPPLVPPSAGGTYSPALVNSDGTDPWAGACTAGMSLVAVLDAPECYDGNNIWAPGGYKHFRQVVTVVGRGRTDCPIGWYRVPTLQVKVWFAHQGFNDYKVWRLSSDDMAATAAGHSFLNGASFHTDWMGGWDDTVFFGSANGAVLGWQKFCTGVAGATPHTCNDAAINATTSLLANATAPDGTRSPQVNFSSTQYSTSNAAQMFPLPSSSHGPMVMNATP